MFSFAVVIPARHASTRLPGKMLAEGMAGCLQGLYCRLTTGLGGLLVIAGFCRICRIDGIAVFAFFEVAASKVPALGQMIKGTT